MFCGHIFCDPARPHVNMPSAMQGGVMLQLFAVLLAQVFSIAPVPPVASIPYGFSNSVIDHNRRLIIFDTTYTYPPWLMPAGSMSPLSFRFPPSVKTRVTIFGNDPAPK